MADGFSDLQSFLRYLERQGELKRVRVEVDPELETAEIATRAVRQGGPALLFERVKGADFPLAMNLFGSARRIELALGRHPTEIGEGLVRLVEDLNPPTLRGLWSRRAALRELLNARAVGTRGPAPVREVSEEPDLTRLPIIKCWPGDGGRFITYPLVLTVDPTTGRRNLGLYRMHLFDARTTGMHWQIQKGGRFHHREAEQAGQPIQVAVALGADPALMLAAAIPLPEGVDEVAFSGLLRRAPCPLVPAETLALKVPANAEFVLEGVVPPGERAPEGPFGDHFGYYSLQAPFPVFHVQRVTRRRNPVYPATVVGRPPQEDRYLGDATQEITAPLLRLIHPEVVGLWTYYEAGFHNLAVAAVRVRYRREAIKAGLALLGEGQLALSKVVILVDEGVDPRDFGAVLAALARNFRVERHLTVIPQAPLDTLDFTSFRPHLGSKMILDATAGVEEDAAPEEASAGEERPVLPLERLGEVDARIRGWRLWGGVLLAVRVSGGGREVAERLVRGGLPARVKIVAVVSGDVDLEDPVSLIWGIFTRFDPAMDLVFASAELRGAVPLYRGPMALDATFKPGYPPVVEMSAEIQEKVSTRWNEYFA